MITKVRSHISQNEPLLFERSSPGKKAYQLPELDVPAVNAAEAVGADILAAQRFGGVHRGHVELGKLVGLLAGRAALEQQRLILIYVLSDFLYHC